MSEAGDAVFRFSGRIRSFPVVNGSADYGLAVRDALLGDRVDCLAIPLPAALQAEVEEAVDALPEIRCVLQRQGDDDEAAAYVPIDPCQPIINAIRIARQERIPVRFIDLEVADYREECALFPDPYALRVLSPEKLAVAVLAALPMPDPDDQRDRRVRHMAFELHKLELDFERVLFVVSLLDWPFVRDAYRRRAPYPETPTRFAPVETFLVEKKTLAFFLAEIPWITWLYERQRRELGEDRSLGVDGIKALLLETRDRLLARKKSARRRVNVKTLRLYLQYVRNLALIRHRLRPDLFLLVEAAKQVFGDDFAIALLETAREYPPQPETGELFLRFAPHRAEHPERGPIEVENLLPGDALEWRPLDLRPEPEEREKQNWSRVWNPYEQCSWPPEDTRIESFNRHVREQAKNLIANDLAKVEKFSASVKDGIDVRETLRNWHSREIWVRELPPARGSLDTVVFLFDVPADPDDYPWRTTWFAEHEEESTLVFFASDFGDDMIGPGIARARYGGAFFLFPPRPIRDIWTDPRFADCTTLEERLLAGAFYHSDERHVAIVSPVPPRASWRRLARRHGKVLVHLPLGRFSTSTIERLRTFHVLNGREVRSFASRFIRGVE
ncbi:MAG: hypothetical protein R3F20_16155 [Planctomycetota bacterium]